MWNLGLGTKKCLYIWLSWKYFFCFFEKFYEKRTQDFGMFGLCFLEFMSEKSLMEGLYSIEKCFLNTTCRSILIRMYIFEMKSNNLEYLFILTIKWCFRYYFFK